MMERNFPAMVRWRDNEQYYAEPYYVEVRFRSPSNQHMAVFHNQSFMLPRFWEWAGNFRQDKDAI